MNIQSKMKTRDAKNNPVTAVLVSVLVMFLLSCLFLLLLAALLYKFDLSESAVKVGIVVIYIVSGVIGGFFMGKIMKTQKFLWGFAAGAIYFCILFLISVLVKQGVSESGDNIYSMCGIRDGRWNDKLVVTVRVPISI